MASLGKPRTSKGLALFCAKIAQEKLAESILLMDMSKIESAPSEYFMICTCNSDIHVRAVSDAILDKCVSFNMEKPRVSGTEYKEWILLDFFDVIAHFMLQEKRSYYQLEKLWSDAKFMKLTEEGKLLSMKTEEVKTVIKYLK